jgi:hypothetical protein
MTLKTSATRLGMITLAVLLLNACKPDDPVNHGTLQLVRARAGDITLNLETVVSGIPPESSFFVEFSMPVDTSTVRKSIVLLNATGHPVASSISFSGDNTVITLTPTVALDYLTAYKLSIDSTLMGAARESFPGLLFDMITVQGKLLLKALTLNGLNLPSNKPLINIDFDSIEIKAEFSDPLNPDDYALFFTLSGGKQLNCRLEQEGKLAVFTNSTELRGYSRYYFTISSNLSSKAGLKFQGFSGSFHTAMDSTDKFPRIPDDELLELIQAQTFRYFYDFGHPACGLARERNSSGDVVTIGGSGFGVMALVVAMERNWISRPQGLTRLDQILGFLETCDRFHGAWPHWVNGQTGKTIPFSTKDNGGDLVETSFMIQGLLAMREYLDAAAPAEAALRNRITTLWEAVEWDWYTRGEDVLYWHWSPDYFFAMNHQIRGHNETLITYILAASSPTHPISATAYHKGYASNGSIRNGKKFYGITLPLGSDYGGPLFFTHYSFLGLDPRNLQDDYANYWQQNVSHSMINMSYCMANPRSYIGYSADCWGLTASDNQTGYSAHSPTNDLGVITPTAAISSLPYTPVESMKAIRHFYYGLGDRLWGMYGFYDAFNVTQGWWASSYLAIDQGPIIVMIENYRTGLLWNLFMESTEISAGLKKLGFTF